MKIEVVENNSDSIKTTENGKEENQREKKHKGHGCDILFTPKS